MKRVLRALRCHFMHGSFHSFHPTEGPLCSICDKKTYVEIDMASLPTPGIPWSGEDEELPKVQERVPVVEPVCFRCPHTVEAHFPTGGCRFCGCNLTKRQAASATPFERAQSALRGETWSDEEANTLINLIDKGRVPYFDRKRADYLQGL